MLRVSIQRNHFCYQRSDARVHVAYDSQAADMGVVLSYLHTCSGAPKSQRQKVDVTCLVFATVTCETRIFYCPVKKLIELF